VSGARALNVLFAGMAAVTMALAAASPAWARVAFGIESFENPILASEGGQPATRAGSHPYSMTTTVMFNHIILNEVHREGYIYVEVGGAPKNMEVKLPSGLTVDPDATVQKCTLAELSINHECPLTTVVGVATVYLYEFGGVSAPIYDMAAPPGAPAELVFEPATIGIPINIIGKVRTGGDYGLSAEVANITQKVSTYGAKVTLWGDPYAESHDAERGRCATRTKQEQQAEKEQYEKEVKEESYEGRVYDFSCPVKTGEESKPLLTMPSSCPAESLATSVSLDSWQEPENYLTALSASPAVADCEKLRFNPSLSVQPAEPEPQAASPESPTGLAVALQLPQEEGLGEAGMSRLATSDLKEAVVTLPTGVTVSPSAANGLETCSLEQIGLNNANAPSCPNGSKVATAQIETPLLEKPLQGAVYLAQQGNLPGNGSNPFGSLFAIYLVAEGSGALVKLPGKVELNPESGQVSARFGENPLTGQWLPQLTFSDLKMSFFGGPRAPLVTPSGCGTFTTTSQLSPWDGNPAAEPSSSFTIGQGCATSGFAPSFSAGTSDNQGGSFSPFSLTFSRQDGEQHVSGVRVTMPPGLLGRTAGIPQCPEPQASRGECGEGSLLGEATTAVGPGEDPYWVKGGKVYLTGPYNGGAFGLSIVVPTTAGPFTLAGNGGSGKEVVRASIRVNPATAQITVVSDSLPTMLEGVPLDIRTVNVTVDRPEFLLNPTDCEALKVEGMLGGTQGATAAVSTPFRAANCAALPFKPSLSASTSGHTSKADGASLGLKLTSPGIGQAGIAKLDLTIPKIMPARLTTLQKACTAAQFDANPAGCPQASDIGTAVVHTPLLNSPLQGPAYLVSHGNAAFPDVEIVLQGEGVELVLDGHTQIKDGVTYSRFEAIPDTPFTTFEFNAPEGPYSIFTTEKPGETNLCAPATTKTATVKERVLLRRHGTTVRRHGHSVYVTEKVKETVTTPQKLLIPATIVAHDGAMITRTTKVAASGCRIPTKASATNKQTGITNKPKRAERSNEKSRSI
jgi:hypothetical protein